MSAETAARAYCLSIGAAPDALVHGYVNGVFVVRPRWRWYVGARPTR